jgi:CBS-domain-containing membrane protein
MEQVPVGEIMTRDVVSIAPKLGVDMAIQVMGMHEVRRLPVLSQGGRLVGIIVREEARVAVERSRAEPEFGEIRMPLVRDVMTRDVHAIGPHDTVGRAAQLMVVHRVGGLPVVEDRKLVGIVTESDLFRFMVKQLQASDPAAETP